MIILACFDIEDDKIRRNVANKLLAYGDRVQYSVFEIIVKNQMECDRLFITLHEMMTENDDLRFYPLCRHCLIKTKGTTEQPGYFPSKVVL